MTRHLRRRLGLVVDLLAGRRCDCHACYGRADALRTGLVALATIAVLIILIHVAGARP